MGNSGILSSVAAGVSLMIASVVVMLVLSSMVAFKGWPGMNSVQESRGAVSVASAQTATAQARQRVVLGSRSSRAATRRRARSGDRRPVAAGGAARARRKIASVRRTSADRRPTASEPREGEVLGASATGGESSPPEGAPTPVTSTRDAPGGPIVQALEHVAADADGLLRGAGVDATPLTDVIDALSPQTP